MNVFSAQESMPETVEEAVSAEQLVSRHDIARSWVALFEECQQYRCRQEAVQARLQALHVAELLSDSELYAAEDAIA